MELKQAITILKLHNEWRRYNGFSITSNMQNPKEIGIAIDTVVSHFETKNTDNNCKACGIEIEDKPRYCDVCTCRSNEAYKE